MGMTGFRQTKRRVKENITDITGKTINLFSNNAVAA